MKCPQCGEQHSADNPYPYKPHGQPCNREENDGPCTANDGDPCERCELTERIERDEAEIEARPKSHREGQAPFINDDGEPEKDRS